MNRLRLGSFILLAAAGMAACTDVDSPTELHPEGPPMIQQVFMTERITDANGVSRVALSLAFGEHLEFAADNPNDDGVVVNATVAAAQRIRVVMDELLIGNTLEQIACRPYPTPSDPITYQSVPEGTTPDDIARCAVGADVLPQTCVGDHAVCLDPGTGAPMGVLDENEDGASDDTQFMCLERSGTGACNEAAVKLLCDPVDGSAQVDVPLSLSNTFWQPSGNQQVPAAGGYNAIGPAIIIAPAAGLPTSSNCHLQFHPSVVDKDHIQVCTPPGGDINATCNPGDTSGLSWGTEILRVLGTNPPNNATNVPLASAGGNANILVQFNASVSGTFGAGAFTLDEGGTPRTDITIARDNNNNANVNIVVPGGYVAGTTYTLTVSEGVTDVFGVALPDAQTATITWTTVAP